MARDRAAALAGMQSITAAALAGMPPITVVRHARARRMRLSISPVTGEVRLTLPPRAPMGPARAWAEGKRAWIADELAKLPPPRPFVPGAVIELAGMALTLRHDPMAARGIVRDGDHLSGGGPIESFAPCVERWLRREALALLAADTEGFAARLGVAVDGVSVGDPAGRWGSCSSRGAIRYSWRLIMAPVWVRRATAAHEVAHRIEMNHSPRFHALVATLVGADGDLARAWLRRHGAALHWFGRSS